jgi:hypothetical protein
MGQRIPDFQDAEKKESAEKEDERYSYQESLSLRRRRAPPRNIIAAFRAGFCCYRDQPFARRAFNQHEGEPFF